MNVDLKEKRNDLKEFLFRYRHYFAYFFMALCSLVFVIYYSGRGSMWYDEMHTLGYALGNEKPNSSFIVFALMRFFVQHIPFGQKNIYLLSEVFFACSVYLIGVVGKKIRNGTTGGFACAIMAFSPYLIEQSAHEFRMYFMLLFMSTLMLYLFIKRGEDKYKNNIAFMCFYGFANMLLVDCHEFGKLLAALLIFLDLCMIIAKKLSKIGLLTLIFPIGYVVYWLLNNEIGWMFNNYAWPPNPTPDLVFSTIKLLLNKSNILVLMFGLGTIYIFYLLYKDMCNKINPFGDKINYYILIYAVFAVFAADIIYSNIINPDNSLYVDRYFLSIVPFMYIISACGLEILYSMLISNRKEYAVVTKIAIVLSIMCMSWQVYINEPKEHNQMYRETAEFLSQEKVVFEEDTAVFIPENGYVVTGWRYFFTKNGELPNINLYNKYNFDLTTCNYKKIYLLELMYPLTEEQQTYFDENYILIKEIDNFPIKIYERKN